MVFEIIDVAYENRKSRSDTYQLWTTADSVQEVAQLECWKDKSVGGERECRTLDRRLPHLVL